MDDLSDRAAGSMWPTGQHAGAITRRPGAMSAPGGESFPGITRVPDPPDVPEATVSEYDGRHLVRGES